MKINLLLLTNLIFTNICDGVESVTKVPEEHKRKNVPPPKDDEIITLPPNMKDPTPPKADKRTRPPEITLPPDLTDPYHPPKEDKRTRPPDITLPPDLTDPYHPPKEDKRNTLP